jgi:hypothetical protein
MTIPARILIVILALVVPGTVPGTALAQSRGQSAAPARTTLPRTADGKPNLQGIWQVRNRAAYDLRAHHSRLGMLPGTSVIDGGGDIPYQPAAAAKRVENYKKRKELDPLEKCFLPGVPRIMYMEHPFQIFQTPTQVAMTFEWSQVYRLIYTDGSKHTEGIDFWMGDSRGRWEGDTLVVDVANHNDKTWLDAAGDFHSEALKLTERYTLKDANTIDYEVTFEDPKVFTAPWKIRMPLYRQTDMPRLLEYQCQAEVEEANGAFERSPRTWYPDDPAEQQKATAVASSMAMPPLRPAPAPTGPFPRLKNGKPDLQGHYQPDNGGANYGLEAHAALFLTPPSRGIIVEPADKKLPIQAWAVAERDRRLKPEGGYDDPTAHCFVAGVPRSMYTPSPYQFVQTDDYLVMTFERMSWRVIPLTARPHLPDHVRLWQGDSVGHWEGDSLVVETTNMNGKTWLNEYGDVITHAQRIRERFTPLDAKSVQYEATITDPLAYTAPWTVSFPLRRVQDEILEVACHEDNEDLQHLKDVRDAARRTQGDNK